MVQQIEGLGAEGHFVSLVDVEGFVQREVQAERGRPAQSVESEISIAELSSGRFVIKCARVQPLQSVPILDVLWRARQQVGPLVARSSTSQP